MTWIKENKFLFGFLLVLLVGVGALGNLLRGAKAKYDESSAAYESKVSELTNLTTKGVYPSQENLGKVLAQKKEATEQVAKLATALAEQQIPEEEITPAGFQDQLKAAVNDLKAKAAKAPKPVALGDTPDSFFLGFDRYETAPPDANAAVALGRQLKVIEWVVGKMIDSGVTTIHAINRPELPEEKEKERDKGKSDEKGGKSAQTALRKNPFEVTFLAEQRSFKRTLNGIIESKEQFLIPRVVIVKNTQEKVPRALPGAFAAPFNPDGTPAAAPATPAATYIVGEEKVEVQLYLEAVDFEAPAATAAK